MTLRCYDHYDHVTCYLLFLPLVFSVRRGLRKYLHNRRSVPPRTPPVCTLTHCNNNNMNCNRGLALDPGVYDDGARSIFGQPTPVVVHRKQRPRPLVSHDVCVTYANARLRPEYLLTYPPLFSGTDIASTVKRGILQNGTRRPPRPPTFARPLPGNSVRYI